MVKSLGFPYQRKTWLHWHRLGNLTWTINTWASMKRGMKYLDQVIWSFRRLKSNLVTKFRSWFIVWQCHNKQQHNFDDKYWKYEPEHQQWWWIFDFKRNIKWRIFWNIYNIDTKRMISLNKYYIYYYISTCIINDMENIDVNKYNSLYTLLKLAGIKLE